MATYKFYTDIDIISFTVRRTQLTWLNSSVINEKLSSPCGNVSVRRGPKSTFYVNDSLLRITSVTVVFAFPFGPFLYSISSQF